MSRITNRVQSAPRLRRWFEGRGEHSRHGGEEEGGEGTPEKAARDGGTESRAVREVAVLSVFTLLHHTELC